MMESLATHLHITGEIAVIPTDTVYGVVARAADQQAVARLYQLKHREAKPGTLIAANVDQFVDLGIDRRHLVVAETLWPAAVSVVVPCGENLFYIHQGINSLAVRIPNDTQLRELLVRTGPLLTSSANQPGESPATTVDEARLYFGDQIDWYEDGGVVNRESSTVVEIEADSIHVLRDGAVKFNDLR